MCSGINCTFRTVSEPHTSYLLYEFADSNASTSTSARYIQYRRSLIDCHDHHKVFHLVPGFALVDVAPVLRISLSLVAKKNCCGVKFYLATGTWLLRKLIVAVGLPHLKPQGGTFVALTYIQVAPPNQAQACSLQTGILLADSVTSDYVTVRSTQCKWTTCFDGSSSRVVLADDQGWSSGAQTSQMDKTANLSRVLPIHDSGEIGFGLPVYPQNSWTTDMTYVHHLAVYQIYDDNGGCLMHCVIYLHATLPHEPEPKAGNTIFLSYEPAEGKTYTLKD
ncbi:hypothetical protein DFH29DRAFT_876507 [Suillus ampliporus]|nr:hypothetical protein DFH29DRAFT_876507 [Suillus ampliporus]